MTDNILQVLDRIEAERAQRDAGEAEPRNALEYVQDVYRGRSIADPWRMRGQQATVLQLPAAEKPPTSSAENKNAPISGQLADLILT
jgi:hypothetical protein